MAKRTGSRLNTGENKVVLSAACFSLKLNKTNKLKRKQISVIY